MSELFCWLIRGSLFIKLGCLRDLGRGWRGDLGTFMISRPIWLKSDWLKFGIWNGVMEKYPIRFCFGIRSNLRQTSCQPRADLVPTSGRPDANPDRPHANLRQTSCQPQADLIPTSGRPHANLMPTLCRPWADLIPTLCRPCANLMQTSCQPQADLVPM